MTAASPGGGGAAGRLGPGRAGRPLRFLGTTLLAWTAFRAAWLWPGIDTGEALIRAVVPPLAAAGLPPEIARARTLPAVRRATRSPPVPAADPGPATVAPVATALRDGPMPPTPPAGTDRVEAGTMPPPLGPPPPDPATGPTPSAVPAPTRWSGSAWAILRARGRAGEVIGGSQLGGSQAGARLAYALDDARRAALAVRFAAPLEGRGRELGLGAELRLVRGLRVIAEQRIAVDGGRGGPSVSLVGGAGPVPLAAGFRLEAYGQAGAVRRGRTDAFADGASRIARRLGAAGAAARLDLGLGAWGGAQRGAARLDMGPTLGAVLPVPGNRLLRVTLDWRRRVAGAARPGSGLALSAGMDF